MSNLGADTVGQSTVYVRAALNRRKARAKARAAGKDTKWELGSGTWAMGPEIRAALLLVAEVWCQIGHRGRVRAREAQEWRAATLGPPGSWGQDAAYLLIVSQL